VRGAVQTVRGKKSWMPSDGSSQKGAGRPAERGVISQTIEELQKRTWRARQNQVKHPKERAVCTECREFLAPLGKKPGKIWHVPSGQLQREGRYRAGRDSSKSRKVVGELAGNQEAKGGFCSWKEEDQYRRDDQKIISTQQKGVRVTKNCGTDPRVPAKKNMC